MMLSAIFSAQPSGYPGPGGYTSTSFAVKSVSGPSVDTHSLTVSGPATTTSSSSGSVSNTSTSERAARGSFPWLKGKRASLR